MKFKLLSGFALTALLIFVGVAFSPMQAQAQHSSKPALTINAEILKYVNEHRASLGLNALVMNDVINTEAEGHSRNMANHKVPFSHDGFDGRADRIRKAITSVFGWAENVAYGANNAREAVDMWLKSPGHKKNIEGNYNLTGIGVAKSADGSLYFTQIFINKRG
jgi:uncharacterized protein YkwD